MPPEWARTGCPQHCIKKFFAPMGSLANREGGVVGDNLAGSHSTFNGVVGSFVMKAFESCIDALNAVANVADNMAIKDFLDWIAAPSSQLDWLALDIRHPKEVEPFAQKFGDLWLGIPYNEIRWRFNELPLDKTLIIICVAGTRSYEIQVFLDSIGRKNTLVLGRRLQRHFPPRGGLVAEKIVLRFGLRVLGSGYRVRNRYSEIREPLNTT